MRRIIYILILLTYYSDMGAQLSGYKEQHRPQYHFSPQANWMNDPNGMVFYKGEYHLFYQYYPDSTVWGPMHWGHAISNDMVHWQHLPIALYPDSLGYIFSGSVVVDKNNTSGFQKGEEAPLVAVFTYHNMKGEKAGTNDFQTQGIAYSNDKGRTWIKYKNNPVLKNPGNKDFRDPKVNWHEASKHWVMSLAVGNKIQFYRSSNLIDWSLTGEFGERQGNHGGVWECPDLFPVKINNTTQEKWVLLVSIGNGGPNGGSATQYFIGDFDGNTFINDNPASTILWIDYGCDNYAGVTWNNTSENKRLFLGWMSNWQYAQIVPTKNWRSAMTLPRELSVQKTTHGFYLVSNPVKALEGLRKMNPLMIKETKTLITTGLNELLLEYDIEEGSAQDFGVVFSNMQNEQLKVGYNKNSNEFYIDRTKAGKSDFHSSFANKQTATRTSTSRTLKLHLFVDRSSLELYADDGLTVLTTIFFPNEDLTRLQLYQNKGKSKLKKAKLFELQSIW